MSLQFPEYTRLMRLLDQASKNPKVEIQLLDELPYKGQNYPIYSLKIGSRSKSSPTLGVFGGVHGLERVGSQMAMAFLEGLIFQLQWDEHLNLALDSSRIVSIPMVNPVGIHRGTRCNRNGVDLMRNAPLEADGEVPFLLGGHRISPRLPFYRGPLGAPLETETKIVIDFCKNEMFSSQSAIVVDLHSGFGTKDRLWHPWAMSKRDFPLMPQVQAIQQLLDGSFPNHVYLIEAQSKSYTTHGDIWDYLLQEHLKTEAYKSGKIFLPWTLEMGSWIWVRKNPMQFFSLLGPFNPMKPHRLKRVMRRHLLLLDFLWRIAKSPQVWSAGPTLGLPDVTKPKLEWTSQASSSKQL